MRIEDIMFWILMFVIIVMSIWLAFGLPDFESSLLMLTIFVAGSEILLWKALFLKDKKVVCGFEKVRSDFRVMNNRFGSIEKNIEEIRDLIKGIG